MKHLLAEAHRAAVARFALSKVLVGLDFDGTLAPIVDEPNDARMRPETSKLVAALAAVYPCAVVSGRSSHDVASRLDGIADVRIVGNHGAEPLDRDPASAPTADQFLAVAGWAHQLRPVVGALHGVEVEDKGLSIAVHYRRALDHVDCHSAIMAAVARLHPSPRVVPGKLAVNLVPFGTPHKGDAMLQLIESVGAQRAIYIGDDGTDEDVFALDDERLFCVRVGLSNTSRAPYYLGDQSEIDDFLRLLLAHRPAPASQ